MVSPVYKQGYPLFPLGYSPDGEKVILYTLASLAEAPGAGESALQGSVYVDQRAAAGWDISPLNSPLTQYVSQVPVAVEARSGETLWEQRAPSQPVTTSGLYVRSADGSLRSIGPLTPPTGFDHPVAASVDFSHVVLEAGLRGNDWPFDSTEGLIGSVYEYSGANNQEPILIGVDGEKGSTQSVGLCGTELGGGPEASEYNAISSDGETIFFTAVPVGWFGCSGSAAPTAELYARIHGALTSPTAAKTLHVSENACTVGCGGESGKNFEGASENGKRVFFTSTQKLTDQAVNGAASGDASTEEGCAALIEGAGGCNLYTYDLAASPGKRLEVVSEGGEVLGVAGIAEDGERVYYVAREALGKAGVNQYGQAPQETLPNLYVYDVATRKTTFIATLGKGDRLDWVRPFTHPTEVAGDGGQFLLFASSMAGLTPDDRTARTQLFEYNAIGGELVRITKGEDGYAENGNDVSAGIDPTSIWTTAEALGNRSDFKSRMNSLNIATDGKTVVFVTRGQLSPLAISAQKKCRSLYEFHTDGPLTTGTVRLLSDGRDTQLYKGVSCGPLFEKMDASGANVLFLTADPLLSADADGVQEDLYDARIGGGFSSARAVGLCGVGSCEEVSTGASSLSVPASLSESGEGPLVQENLKPLERKRRPKKRSNKKHHNETKRRVAKWQKHKSPHAMTGKTR